MERFKLNAIHRERLGKGASRSLRRSGMIPGILYGPRTSALPIAINSVDLNKLIGGKRESILVDLEILMNGNRETKTVMIKEVQRDPVRDFIIHVDLYEVAMDVSIRIEVPVHLIGKPAGIQKGGIVEHIMRTIEIECLPSDIPDKLEIDISHLEIGDSIHISDIKTSPGVKIIEDPSSTVVAIVAPEAEEEKATPAEEIAQLPEPQRVPPSRTKE